MPTGVFPFIAKQRFTFSWWAAPLLAAFVFLGGMTGALRSSDAAGFPYQDTPLPGASMETYKTINGSALHAHIFFPADHKAGDKRPAIVCFFGGGWNTGSPVQFLHQCEHFASEGMVAITVDYRVRSRQHTTPMESVADAKSAIRWVRANAGRLGVDPDKIVAAGGSAGGHIAACTGIIDGLDEPTEDQAIRSKPDAMILFNPVLDMSPAIVGKLGEFSRAMEISPLQHVHSGQPPTIVFHGKADTTVPYSSAVAFEQAMKKAGNRCELVGFEGQKHGFFNYRGDDGGEIYNQTMADADGFLASLGYVKPAAGATSQPASK
jgi:acetyl esterase/lipase